MNKVDVDAERCRLAAIFEEIEAEERGEIPLPSERMAESRKTDAERMADKIERAASQIPANIANCCRNLVKDNACKTKRENILALAYIKLYESGEPALRNAIKEKGEIRQELEIYKNLVLSIAHRLEDATKVAKEQDNHHYYKMFADKVRKLLETIGG